MYPCVTLICQVTPIRCISTLFRDYAILRFYVAFGFFRALFFYRSSQHFTIISYLLAFGAAISIVIFLFGTEILYLNSYRVAR